MLIVYTPYVNNRTRYAVDLVLHVIGGQEYKLVDRKEDISTEHLVINYSGEHIEGSFQIHPNGLLSEKVIKSMDVPFNYDIEGKYEVKLFTTEFDALGFDIFSASFFLVTRYEEYWKYKGDEHGRYQAKYSIAYKLGFLRKPLVNSWVKQFLKDLSTIFKVEFSANSSFKIINTIDVDTAWAHLHKGLLRTTGAMAKSLIGGRDRNGKGPFSSVKDRIKSLSGAQKDPYDTFDLIQKISAKKNVESIYFILLGDYGPMDKNVRHDNKHLQTLVKQIDTYAKVGIHPSYNSYQNEQQLEKEVGRLHSMLNKPVQVARKHYLRLSIPDCYRMYEKVGVNEDHTMGYAEEVGFRASICTAYPFFDVLQDRVLHVDVHPFAYMDGALNEDMDVSIEDAMGIIEQLKGTVKQVGGNFIGIWHNDTIAEAHHWKGWREVYETALS